MGSEGLKRDTGAVKTCEQYAGCTRDARFRITNLGGNAHLDALDHLDVCERCADEWREWHPENAIQKLTCAQRRAVNE